MSGLNNRESGIQAGPVSLESAPLPIYRTKEEST